jgi:hypothetical protein
MRSGEQVASHVRDYDADLRPACRLPHLRPGTANRYPSRLVQAYGEIDVVGAIETQVGFGKPWNLMHAGRIPRRPHASASNPVQGMIGAADAVRGNA